MIEKLSLKIVDCLLKNTCYTEEKREILLFGTTRIVEDVPKMIGILILGIVLNILKEILIITIVITLYKTFVGGVHAKTNLGCFVSSVVFYLSIIYVSKYVDLKNEIYILGLVLNYIFALYCIWVYVPADVPEIPKIDKTIRRKNKIKALIMLNIIYVVTLVVVKDKGVQNLVMLSIYSINLMTTRTMYNLFKNEYGYETYFPYCE